MAKLRNKLTHHGVKSAATNIRFLKPTRIRNSATPNMKKKLLLPIALITLALTSSRAETIIALTSANHLLTFDSAAPGTLIKTVTITGLPITETLVAMDFRPVSGGLYALGASNRLYLINPGNGAATAVGAAGAFTLMGARFGFDFNPTVDRIRVTSDQAQNIRLDPATGGLTATDTPLNFAAGDPNAGLTPHVVGSAYTNSVAGATNTTLYDIDSNRDILVMQSPPNLGTLNTVGSLGVGVTDSVGFDISPTTGVAYASMILSPPSPDIDRAQLYTINLTTGAATSLGIIALPGADAAESVVDIALPTTSRLLNFAARGRVGTGNDVLIGGFISSGALNSRFLLRAIGPSLPAPAVGTPLADPILTLFDSNGILLKTNDDWMTQANASDLNAINATGIPPSNNLESAIFADLAPGAYTAIVTGKNGGTGVALVEIYQLP